MTPNVSVSICGSAVLSIIIRFNSKIHARVYQWVNKFCILKAMGLGCSGDPPFQLSFMKFLGTNLEVIEEKVCVHNSTWSEWMQLWFSTDLHQDLNFGCCFGFCVIVGLWGQTNSIKPCGFQMCNMVKIPQPDILDKVVTILDTFFCMTASNN